MDMPAIVVYPTGFNGIPDPVGGVNGAL